MTIGKAILAALAPSCPASIPPQTVLNKLNSSGELAEKITLSAATEAMSRLVKNGWCAIDVDYDGNERWLATPEGKARWILDGRPLLG